MPYNLIQTQDLIGWNGDRSDVSWITVMVALRAKMSQHVVRASSTLAPPTLGAPPQIFEPAIPASRAHRTDSSGEDNFWNSIKDSIDAAEFDAYLGAFPEGLYASLARLRRDRLRPATSN